MDGFFSVPNGIEGNLELEHAGTPGDWTEEKCDPGRSEVHIPFSVDLELLLRRLGK